MDIEGRLKSLAGISLYGISKRVTVGLLHALASAARSGGFPQLAYVGELGNRAGFKSQ